MHDTTTPLAFAAFFGGIVCGVLLASVRFLGQFQKYREEMDRKYEAWDKARSESRYDQRKHRHHDEDEEESWR